MTDETPAPVVAIEEARREAAEKARDQIADIANLSYNSPSLVAFEAAIRAVEAEALRAATARAERAEQRLSLHHEVKVLAMTLGLTEAEVWGRNCPVCAALSATEEGQG